MENRDTVEDEPTPACEYASVAETTAQTVPAGLDW